MLDAGLAAGAARLVESASRPPSARSTQDWLAVVAHCQELVNVATAAQDAAIVRLAAIEREYAEDGTVVDEHRPLGHCALDAPDLVSGVLPISRVQAERRVSLAIRCAADGNGAALGASTGLRGLHEAMAAGVLDSYRASVVADELHEAPAAVAATVVLALEPHLATDTPAALRQRCRRTLARISPDLLRQRARRVREECGLRRWADEPGVDHWDGTFPSEDAAVAWAAIDGLAQRYVADGTCAPIERARAKALTDLVAGQATVDITLALTVPDHHVRPEPGTTPPTVPDDQAGPGAEASPGEVQGEPVRPAADTPAASGARVPDAVRGCAAEDLVEVGGLVAGDPVLVSGAWMRRLIRAAGGIPLCPRAPASAGRGAFGGAAAQGEAGPGHMDLPRPVRARRRRRVRPRHRARPAIVLSPCDPATGALLDAILSAEDSYRPSARLAALVRARDRRCRFPACSVAARFCDLDHVRPWPVGATSAANLMCLCRRHHRIKQRPGWRVGLARDGTVTWVDPAGTIRVTHPVDALHGLLLDAGGSGRDASGGPGTSAARVPRRTGVTARAGSDDRVSVADVGVPDARSRRAPGLWNDLGPHSAVEFGLEHAMAGWRGDDASTTRRRLARQGVRTELLPARFPAALDPSTVWHRSRRRPAARLDPAHPGPSGHPGPLRHPRHFEDGGHPGHPGRTSPVVSRGHGHRREPPF